MMTLLAKMAISLVLMAPGAIAQNPPSAPVAHKETITTEVQGDKREDNYAWLRDDSRLNKTVLNYLDQENHYTEQVSAQWQPLNTEIYNEMRQRQVAGDYTQPLHKHDYSYKTEFSNQADFPQIMRKKKTQNSWQPVIDTSIRSAGKPYYSLGGYTVSEDNRYIALAEDWVGDGQYQIDIYDTRSGQWLTQPIHQAANNMVFSNDGSGLYYVELQPKTLTPYKVIRYNLVTQKREVIWQEDDHRFFTGIARSASNDYLMVILSANDTSEIRYLPLNRTIQPLAVLRPRISGHEYYADHANGYFYIRSNHENKNFALYRVKNNEAWQSVLAADPERELDGFTLFNSALVVSLRYDGKTHYSKLNFHNNHWQDLRFPDSSFMARSGSNNDGDAQHFNYIYSSLNKPLGYYQWDLASGETRLVHQRAVPGFIAEKYSSKLITLHARDGEAIPVSLIWRKDRFKPNHNPLLVYGYGAYGISLDAAFSAPRLSLLDRGFVFALVHVRGGGEKGVAWYQAGKKAYKQNSFNDFNDATRGLIEQGYGAASRIYAMGGSAGGLLVAGAINQAPELFQAAVLQVPFVDVLNTMLDKSLPLTQQEYNEWGNPDLAEDYHRMKTWSPYDNIKPHAWPSLLVTSGLYDSRVPYWEAAKYIARIRANNTQKNSLQLLSINMNSGHEGTHGRYSRLEDSAQAFSFLIFVDSKKNK